MFNLIALRPQEDLDLFEDREVVVVIVIVDRDVITVTTDEMLLLLLLTSVWELVLQKTGTYLEFLFIKSTTILEIITTNENKKQRRDCIDPAKLFAWSKKKEMILSNPILKHHHHWIDQEVFWWFVAKAFEIVLLN